VLWVILVSTQGYLWPIDVDWSECDRADEYTDHGAMPSSYSYSHSSLMGHHSPLICALHMSYWSDGVSVVKVISSCPSGQRLTELFTGVYMRTLAT